MGQADPDVLYAIELYGLCKEFRVLPDAGGLFDQGFEQVMVLQAVSAAHAKLQEEQMEADKKKTRHR